MGVSRGGWRREASRDCGDVGFDRLGRKGDDLEQSSRFVVEVGDAHLEDLFEIDRRLVTARPYVARELTDEERVATGFFGGSLGGDGVGCAEPKLRKFPCGLGTEGLQLDRLQHVAQS